MLMVYPHPELEFTHILPYGALIHDRGVQFVVFSRSATGMRLLLYDNVQDSDPTEVFNFDRDSHRWGNIWSLFVPGLGPGQLYHFQADGPNDPDLGMWFDGQARLIDPYAKALAGRFQPHEDGVIRPPKCVVVDDHFDWKGDRHLRRDLSETIIYEMHVRGFTINPNSHVKHPGTYLGVIEKIPYLQSLGITAVELMPVHEFPINNILGQSEDLPNYWGYDPLAFFAPHRGYAAGQDPGCQIYEFKEMVRALHQAGIEVILDVVFNHTCEGNELGPVLTFKGLENQVYYMLDQGGSQYRNYSGCGNTVNGNHPIVREMIFHCLRHWVHNYHIDGFRFDLASILSRDRRGELVPNPPLVEMIAEDPLLADTKIIAEAWDAAGAYQVGSFGEKRWAEWNGRFRDDLRLFWRGEEKTLGHFATRLAGSSDLYESSGRHPYHSINFLTSHDGFTLNDLVSYSQKHNESNSEGNRDGENNNYSANSGVEGPTDDAQVNKIRLRQIRNMLASLMLSQGVPMLLTGDECRRTQEGNNNAYCQDNETSWFNWDLVEENQGLVRFVSALIAFRRLQPTVRSKSFLKGTAVNGDEVPDVRWYSALGGGIDWDNRDLTLMCWLTAASSEECNSDDAAEVLMMFNAMNHPRCFRLPIATRLARWELFVDTAADHPHEIYPEADGPPPPAREFWMPEHSLRCYVAKT